jgi:DNA-binding response OmpR family regulator
VLFTSGYTNDPDELLAGVSAAFISKPFSPQALVAKVREILN